MEKEIVKIVEYGINFLLRKQRYLKIRLYREEEKNIEEEWG